MWTHMGLILEPFWAHMGTIVLPDVAVCSHGATARPLCEGLGQYEPSKEGDKEIDFSSDFGILRSTYPEFYSKINMF